MRRLALVMALAGIVITLAPAAHAQDEICSFGGGVGPGQSQSRTCAITNQAPVDGTFWYAIAEGSLVVLDANDHVVTGADRNTYLGFFRISIEAEQVLTALTPTDGEADDQDLVPLTMAARCTDVPLTQLLRDVVHPTVTDCRIGRIRGDGYFPAVFSTRAFVKTIEMLDEGDQSRFAGWGITFDDLYVAAAPALADCPTNCTPAGSPVYVR